jgi:hypothetical protein
MPREIEVEPGGVHDVPWPARFEIGVSLYGIGFVHAVACDVLAGQLWCGATFAVDGIINGMVRQRGQCTISLFTRDASGPPFGLDRPEVAVPLARGDVIVVCSTTEVDRDACWAFLADQLAAMGARHGTN